jgi:hypothetical protein
MTNRLRFALPCVILLGAALYGCHSEPVAAPVQAAPAPVAPVQKEAVVVPTAPGGMTPIKDALTRLLAEQSSSPFPKGTRLIALDVKEGIAVLDFSKEFHALANSGDTTESMAMKALRSTLGEFPEVQKMRVTVEGKPFDSQNTDWTTPFPVRDGAPTTGGEGQGGGK